MSKTVVIKVGTKASIYALQGLVVAGALGAGVVAGVAWHNSKVRKDMLNAWNTSNSKTFGTCCVKINDIMAPLSAAGLSMFGSAFFISSFYELGKLMGTTTIRFIK